VTAFLAAAAAALCYGIGSVLQAVAARRAAPVGFDVRLLTRVATQLPYVAGLGLDLAGFLFAIVALHSLPLFLVQSVVAGSIGVTAVAAVAVLGARLKRVEVVALGLVAVGLVLLAVSARPGRAHPMPDPAQWLVLALLPLFAWGAAAAATRSSAAAGVALAGAAGAGFGAVGVAARGLVLPHPWWHAVTTPAVWTIVGFGLLALLSFAAALQRATVTAAAAVMSAVETVLPSAVGLTVLHDGTRGGIGAAAAGLGFVLTLTGVFGLARYAEVSA
jgi:hypothetical protein